jgi:NAD(P)-dependent dehydrogenase (short-subunit alcohol dehydrogenase family)
LTAPFQWRVVWITGASSGIGREVALQLARAGVRVAVSARSKDALTALAAEQSGIAPFPLDVTDQAAVAATVQSIEAAMGPIDLAILNAGIWQPMGARDFNAQIAADSMSVNYFGITNSIDALMPLMIARRAGHLAFVSSVAGYRGLPKAAAYSPSKAAVISLAETLKPDLAARGVTVSIINPGFVDTPMTQVNTFPMPFMIKPDDAARRIIAGLRAGKFEIAFPGQLVSILKLARILPYRLYFWYVRTFLSPRSGR